MKLSIIPSNFFLSYSSFFFSLQSLSAISSSKVAIDLNVLFVLRLSSLNGLYVPGDESGSLVYEIDVPSIDSLLPVNVSTDPVCLYYTSGFSLSIVPSYNDALSDLVLIY